MSCEFSHLCKKIVSLKQIREVNGFSPKEYSVSELKKDICDNEDPRAREQCCAYEEFKQHGSRNIFAI